MLFPDLSFADKEESNSVDVGDEIVFGNYLQGLNDKEATEYFVDNGTQRNVFGFGLSSYESQNKNIDKTKEYYLAEITSYAYREHLFNNMQPVNGILHDWWLCDSYAGKEFSSYTGGSQGSRFFVNYERVMEKHGVRPAMVIDLNKTNLAALQKIKESQTDSVPVSSVVQKSDYTVMLGFKVKFHRNRLFSRYDVSLYVDNDFICDLKHGEDKEATCRLSKGKHTVYFYKKDHR